MAQDYYEILGVPRGASDEEIKRAYRKLAQIHHPDKPGGDEKKFKEISEAYRTLGDKEKREQYDKFGRAFDGDASGGGFDFSNGFGGFDFNFSEGGEAFSDLFEDFFGFGGGGRARTKDLRRGDDIELGVEMELKDTIDKFVKKLAYERMVNCPRCKSEGAEPGTRVKECFSCRGTGFVETLRRSIFGAITHSSICPECKGEGKSPEAPCNVCKGEGRIKGLEEFDFEIPGGVDTGQSLKVTGMGDAGRRGGKSGDLFVRIFVKPHPFFTRKGDDLHLNLPISFSQAVLGGEIDMPTLEGKEISLKVPSKTESGRVFRIRGKGIPRFSGFGRGDMLVKLVIDIPNRLTKKQKELLEKMKDGK